MAKGLLTLIVLLAILMPLSAQSKPSIQGVWRAVEIAITDSRPADGIHSVRFLSARTGTDSQN